MNEPGSDNRAGSSGDDERDDHEGNDAPEPTSPPRGLSGLYHRLDASVRARILIPTGLLFALIMGTSTLAAMLFYSSEMRAADEERLELVANAIRGEMVSEMLKGRGTEGGHRARVLAAFDRSAATYGARVDAISIINPAGQVAFSSEPELVGSQFAAPASLPTDRPRIDESPDGLVGIVQPVHNEPACASCHGAEQRINGWIEVRLSAQWAIGWLQVVIFAIIAGATLLALIAITWWLLGREVVGPLRRLTRAMARAEAGDESETIPDTDRPDALGAAARSFEATLTALRESQEEVEAFYRERILRVDRFAAVGEVATGLAHEIKNPLAGMLGALEILGEDLDGMQGEIVDKLREEVLRLASVMDSTLNFARSAKVQLRPVDVNQLMGSLDFSLQPHLRRAVSPITIVTDFQEPLPRASADPTQLSQALLNIALNAVQSMEQTGGELTLRTHGDEHRIHLEISDTGSGIPEDVRPHIFEPFFTTKRQGTGIGLAHSARIIAEHGGDIDYQSRVSGGTTFYVILRGAGARKRSETAERMKRQGA